MRNEFDVLIVGGGPAGLSAAMSLGRMSRRVLVCDDGRPRNAAAKHMNNFPSRDGLSPASWRNEVRNDLLKYNTISFRDSSVDSVENKSTYFEAKIGADIYNFRKIILAHGVLDQPLEAVGFKDLWGHAIFHCPYCHGFEVKNTRLGLIANGPMAEHLLPMIYGLSKDLILFLNGNSELSEELRTQTKTNHIKIVEDKIASLTRSGDKLHSIITQDGTSYDRDYLFLAPTLPFKQKSDLGEKLGCEKTDLGFYKVNPFGKTTVNGVFAAGDASSPMHSVLAAAAAGQMTGAAVVSEILSEEFTGVSVLKRE